MRHLKVLLLIAVAGMPAPELADAQAMTDVSDVVSKALNAYETALGL